MYTKYQWARKRRSEAVEFEISSAESCWDPVAPCAITHTVLLHKKSKTRVCLTHYSLTDVAK